MRQKKIRNWGKKNKELKNEVQNWGKKNKELRKKNKD